MQKPFLNKVFGMFIEDKLLRTVLLFITEHKQKTNHLEGELMTNLAKKYKSTQPQVTKRLKDQLILDYSPLIKFIAHKIAIKLPANIELDDLISAGVLGLIDAIEKYDHNRDNKFKTYAEFRIRGAILDDLRSQDWIPRSVRDQAKKIDRANAELEQSLGRNANVIELSEALGIEIQDYHTLINRVKATTLLSVDEMLNAKKNNQTSSWEHLTTNAKNNPFSKMKAKNVRKIMLKTIERLPLNQQLVLSLYYYDNLNLKEIGHILNVSESRVSQLHTRAVRQLKNKLEKSKKHEEI